MQVILLAVAEPAYSKRITKALDALAAVPDPLERLDAIRQTREAVERLEAATFEEARAAGVTWNQIGDLYGMSRQAAQQRFRRTDAAADKPRRRSHKKTATS